MKTIKQRLQERLIKLLPEIGGEIQEPTRVYAGHWQRSSGAWSWEARVNINGRFSFSIGSQHNMAELLKMNDEDFLSWID